MSSGQVASSTVSSQRHHDDQHYTCPSFWLKAATACCCCAPAIAHLVVSLSLEARTEGAQADTAGSTDAGLLPEVLAAGHHLPGGRSCTHGYPAKSTLCCSTMSTST
jgi:hypothetical protein